MHETVRRSDEQMEAARQRLLELWHHLLHCQRDKKRPASALESVPQRDDAGPCPSANDAVDPGVLTVALPRGIEQRKKHWGSELESSRHIQWQGRWQRVDAVAAE